jgi:hypothetical protein
MRLVIRGVEGGAHPNLRTYVPENPEVFDDFVQVHIGQKPGKGADAFTLRVATPAGLAAQPDKNSIIAQSPILVMRRFDFDELWNWLEKTVVSCQGDTWPESVEKLKRYFKWEFEYSKE